METNETLCPDTLSPAPTSGEVALPYENHPANLLPNDYAERTSVAVRKVTPAQTAAQQERIELARVHTEAALAQWPGEAETCEAGSFRSSPYGARFAESAALRGRAVRVKHIPGMNRWAVVCADPRPLNPDFSLAEPLTEPYVTLRFWPWDAAPYAEIPGVPDLAIPVSALETYNPEPTPDEHTWACSMWDLKSMMDGSGVITVQSCSCARRRKYRDPAKNHPDCLISRPAARTNEG